MNRDTVSLRPSAQRDDTNDLLTIQHAISIQQTLLPDELAPDHYRVYAKAQRLALGLGLSPLPPLPLSCPA